MGEVSRVLSVSHKSAEPIKAGHAGTSDAVAGPASEPVMARKTEPMMDAPVDLNIRQLGCGQVELRCELWIVGVLVRAMDTWTKARSVLYASLDMGLRCIETEFHTG
jgi:hypothetical protein